MVIKDKKKFVRRLILILGLTIGIILIMTSEAFSHQELEYKSVAVFYGDTLWNIAKAEQESNSYYKEKDIRDIVENIKKVNKLKNSSLIEGQILEIPVT